MSRIERKHWWNRLLMSNPSDASFLLGKRHVRKRGNRIYWTERKTRYRTRKVYHKHRRHRR